MFIGAGTVINIGAVLAGGGIGLLLRHSFPERTRTLVTQTLGLFTLVIGGTSIASGLSDALKAETGPYAPMLIVLGALLLGGAAGSLIRLEQRIDGLAERLRSRIASGANASTFVEGMVTSTLVFCVGPLSIIGSLSDGMGAGPQQLAVKAMMDGFAAIAFASSLGVGVLACVIPLALYQGALTLLGFALGNFLSPGELDALTATGGVILLGLACRMVGAARVAVGDLLPALVVAPALTALVGAIV